MIVILPDWVYWLTVAEWIIVGMLCGFGINELWNDRKAKESNKDA